MFVWNWFQWVVSFRRSVDDNLISYLAIPQPTLPAVTSHLHLRFISISLTCVCWLCYLCTERALVCTGSTRFRKASDKLQMCSGCRWKLKSTEEVVSSIWRVGTSLLPSEVKEYPLLTRHHAVNVSVFTVTQQPLPTFCNMFINPERNPVSINRYCLFLAPYHTSTINLVCVFVNLVTLPVS